MRPVTHPAFAPPSPPNTQPAFGFLIGGADSIVLILVLDAESKLPALSEGQRERQQALRRRYILRNRRERREHFTHFSPSNCPDW